MLKIIKMNRPLVRKLILYLAYKLGEMDAPISTIRLIKLLYLIDSKYFEFTGNLLTNIEWIKYHFGPYFMDWPTIQRSLTIDLDMQEVETERGRGRTFVTLDEQKIPSGIDKFGNSAIRSIIQKWGGSELDDLLEFVYETSPVKLAEHNQPLDFSYLTDHLALRNARLLSEGFISRNDLEKKYGNPFSE